MSELKVFYSPDGEHTKSYYLKSEADNVIAELKKACNDKDDWCLHTLKENADKDAEIRRLKRALWLARVERAKERKSHFDLLDYFGISVVTINFESARTWMTCKTEEPSKWAIIFEKVEQKCRAMAERFKD